MALLPDASHHLDVYLLLFLAGSLLSLFAARSLSGSSLGFLLFCAAVFRVTLLLRVPDLSDDVYRYLWDGRVAAAGKSPYSLAPADARPDFFPELRREVSYPELRTVYPPVAQAAFRVAASIPAPGILALKALFSAADVAVVALLYASGGAAAPFAAALYAFHPLPVSETAGQGHLDSLGVALLLSCVVLLARRRRIASAIAFALTVLVKYVPLSAAPALLRRGRWWFAAAAVVATVALWMLASRGGQSPAVGLGPYATRWEFNSVLYPAVFTSVDRLDLPRRAKSAYTRWKDKREHRPWMQKIYPYFYTAFFARALIGIVLGVVLLIIGVKVQDIELAVFASVAALLLASPTLHPWYLLWILPFAAKRREPAFLFLCTVAPLAYGLIHPLAGWTPPAIRLVEYGPFVVLLGWTFLRLAVRHREAGA